MKLNAYNHCDLYSSHCFLLFLRRFLRNKSNTTDRDYLFFANNKDR